MLASNLERSFASWLRTEGLPEPRREHQFAPPRKWRFDFAWPDRRVAVELDGLVRGGRGGHQTVAGILADAEKAEASLLMGWRVYRVPGPWVQSGNRAIWRPEVMTCLRHLLGV